MNKYKHLKEKAIVLRKNGKSLNDISEMLSLNKATVYYWIKGEKLPTTDKQRESARAAGIATKKKHDTLRQEAYREGEKEYVSLIAQPTFRDFVVLYLTEGYRRTRHAVSLGNSNPQIVKLAHYWMSRLKNPKRPLDFTVQCHVDNDENEIRKFWADVLGIQPSRVKITRKSNSGELSGRQWRSVNGVLTVRVSDTYFRSRVDAWMTLLQQEWKVV